MLQELKLTNRKIVLVAGGAGYIGSHVCKELHRQNYLPVTIDALLTGHEEAVKWGPLIRRNIRDCGYELSELQVPIYGCIDLTGFSRVDESIWDPIKYYQNNVFHKVDFVQTLLLLGIKNYVFSSSAAVYGNYETSLVENRACFPVNPYGRSKFMFEQIMRDLRGPADFNFVALRYFNAAGADPDGEIGEWHVPETHLIANACRAALGIIPEMEIYGDDYKTFDGTAIRDYVHVSDLARAHVLALEYIASGKESTVFNLGRGKGVSIKEVLEAFRQLGHVVPYIMKPQRAGDPPMLLADIEKAKKMLDWTPRLSLEDMILTAIEWHKKLPR